MAGVLNTAKLLEAEGFALVERPFCIAAFDPAGQGADHPALIVLEREEWQRGEPLEPRFAVKTFCRVRRAERMPAATELPDALARLFRLCKVLIGETAYCGWKLAIEQNGIGAAYVSALRRRLPLGTLVGVTTIATLGDGRQRDAPCAPSGWVMPRQAGLDALRAALEWQAIKVATDAPGAKDLTREMRSFVWKGRRPEAQEGAHDDLVMALALAHWVATRIVPPVLKQQRGLQRAA